MSNETALLLKYAQNFELDIDHEKINKILTFIELIREYSKKQNLVSKNSLNNLINDHIADSLSLNVFFTTFQNNQNNIKLIDIGSGNGFPAIIMAIIYPNIQFTLVDSNAKKIEFLKTAVAQLKIEDSTSVINSRAEELAHNKKYRNHFDLATARAFASVKICLEIISPFLKVSGNFICQKSEQQMEAEVLQALPIMTELSMMLEQNYQAYPKGDSKNHIISIFKKLDHTADKYPRPWSTIIKNK